MLNQKLNIPKACPHCGKLIYSKGFVTCGNSYCQQAEFIANGERNLLKRRRRNKR